MMYTANMNHAYCPIDNTRQLSAAGQPKGWAPLALQQPAATKSAITSCPKLDSRSWKRLTGMLLITFLIFGGCGKRPDQTAWQEGLRALDAGHYNPSIQFFQQAIRDNVSRADNARAYNSLGIAYWRLQQRDNAIRAFENASRMDPKLVEPIYNLGVLQFINGKEAEAVICFEKAALIDSRETRPLEFLAKIYLQRQQWDEARRVLNTALQRAPQAARLITLQALLELQMDNLDAALALLQQALEHDSRYPPAIFNLAGVYQRNPKEVDQARSYFKDYLSLAPTGQPADQARLALNKLAKLPPLTSAESITSQPITATAPLTTSARQAPIKPAPLVVAPTINELLENARKLQHMGRREAAVNNYLKAAGEAASAGNFKQRDAALRLATECCADDARANYELGQYYSEHKQNEQALIFLKKSISLSTNWFEALLALAKTALETEELDTARVAVKQAALCKPEQADNLWSLAQLCDQNNALPDLAVLFYSQFEKKYPADARAATAQSRRKALLAEGALDQSGGAAKTNPALPSRWNRFSR